MNQNKTPWYYLALLILAGESVFILPFVLPRVFRPTVLDTFNLDNVQLGFCFSIYGIVALLSYLFGGPLADKYPPRKLIAVALWMTALGGLVYSTFPSYTPLKMLYGYWGFTTIFLFWAPMIKATRVWGGSKSQGKAFGFLDGGRGLVGALVGTLGILVFSLFLTSEIAEASSAENRMAFRYVILVFTAIISLVGILVWFFLKLDESIEQEILVDGITVAQIKEVLQLPAVILLTIIIMCAYVGYKVTDIISLYAQDVMLYNQIESAQVGTLLLYIRPIIGVLLGVIADLTNTTFWLMLSFLITFTGALLFATGIISQSGTALFFLSILVFSVGVYAARSLYFAVMERGQIPIMFTGTAVPGEVGHQHVFWMLAGFSFVGGLAAWYYYKLFGRVKNL